MGIGEFNSYVASMEDSNSDGQIPSHETLRPYQLSYVLFADILYMSVLLYINLIKVNTVWFIGIELSVI